MRDTDIDRVLVRLPLERNTTSEQAMTGGGVAAVDRSLAILDAFTEQDDVLTLAELSKRTGLHKSTLIRLAESLEKFGYVRRADKGIYRLGSKVLFLGSLYQKHFRTS